ncbi:MAG: hypothetical protein ACOC56_05910, partial [Atribacterota bacterium]
ASIKEWKISIDPAIEYNETTNSNTIKLDIPMLNPSEKVEIHILSSTNTTLPEKPKISLRGEGIIGKMESEQMNDTSQLDRLFLMLISLLVGVGLLFLSLLSLRARVRELKK